MHDIRLRLARAGLPIALLLLAPTLLPWGAGAQEDQGMATLVYLVRHSEKEAEPEEKADAKA